MSDADPLRAAAALAQAGRIAEAIVCLESALAESRDESERPANISLIARTAGLLCETSGQLSQAATYYEEAATTAPEDPLPLAALAPVLWQLGETDAALSALAKAESLAQSSSHVEAKEILAKVRAQWASEC